MFHVPTCVMVAKQGQLTPVPLFLNDNCGIYLFIRHVFFLNRF